MDYDSSSAEKYSDISSTLPDHIDRLKTRLVTEPDDLQRQILQARIDNMVLAQKKIQALLMAPGHA